MMTLLFKTVSEMDTFILQLLETDLTTLVRE